MFELELKENLGYFYIFLLVLLSNLLNSRQSYSYAFMLTFVKQSFCKLIIILCVRESGWQSGKELDFYTSNPGLTPARVSTMKKIMKNHSVCLPWPRVASQIKNKKSSIMSKKQIKLIGSNWNFPGMKNGRIFCHFLLNKDNSQLWYELGDIHKKIWFFMSQFHNFIPKYLSIVQFFMCVTKYLTIIQIYPNSCLISSGGLGNQKSIKSMTTCLQYLVEGDNWGQWYGV